MCSVNMCFICWVYAQCTQCVRILYRAIIHMWWNEFVQMFSFFFYLFFKNLFLFARLFFRCSITTMGLFLFIYATIILFYFIHLFALSGNFSPDPPTWFCSDVNLLILRVHFLWNSLIYTFIFLFFLPHSIWIFTRFLSFFVHNWFVLSYIYIYINIS